MTVNTQEFYRELERLTQLGYLERPQLDRIRDEYLKTRKERHNIFLIFALLGVVFIGAGVISLFAWNWSMFSRELKAVIALIPLLAVQGCLWWKYRAGAAEIWIQSLSLALGLADVVQEYAGGVHLDAMFIDEGFGTLDEHSIADALAILQTMTQGKGMIGIISHVEILKENIQAGIAVVKTREGSYIQIRKGA